jgi:type IV/VI secretion system ImpK/VasF family protein
MVHVGDLFSKLFTYVLLFEQSTVSGQVQLSYEQVRGDIVRLIEQQKAIAKRQGMLDQEYQDAAFAAVAWVDETILKLTAWEHVNRWKASPLQLELYQTRNAGEEFFERLARLRPEQQEIREVYFVALGLGFTGRYFFGQEDALALAQIRGEQARHLSLPLEDVQSIDKIAPQPYESSPPKGEPLKPPWTHLLLKVGVALLVIVPLTLMVLLWLWPRPVQQFQMTVRKSGSGGGTVTSADAGIQCGVDCARPYAQGTEVVLKALPDPGSVFSQWDGDPDCADGRVVLNTDKTCTAIFNRERRPDEDIRRELVQRLTGQPCVRIAVAVQAGAVHLSGRVADAAQRAEIRAIGQDTKDVIQVDDTDTEIIPRPFCQVLDLLEPFKEYSAEHKFGLVARLDKPGDRPTYMDGDNLVLESQTPGTFASHFYVDYYTADAGVAHLFPNPKQGTGFFTPGSTVIVDLDRLGLEIQEPFGLELITVIASKTPLFATPRYDPEPAEQYLSELRRALPKEVATSEVAMTFYFITTRQR